MSDDAQTQTTFEVGPIRPPNEAASLLVRVTRNCPWNRCTFCPVYKGQKFSLRDPEEVKADIAAMARLAKRAAGGVGEQRSPQAMQVARFVSSGGDNAFLQDANSLIMPVDALADVLRFLRKSFPMLRRVTSYARSHTVRKRSLDELRRLREAGLDRIHIGLESGSDQVLALVEKGITAERHIEAGLRVKEAGIELSEYIMPGLGGRALSEEHATETARVLRAIDPHFVRLRTLAIRSGSPMAELCARGEFEQLGDVDVANELRTLLGGFTGMTSIVCSDHILNLLEEIEGELPADLPRMMETVDRFLALEPDERDTFIVGRRLGVMRRLDDLGNPAARAHALKGLANVRRHFPGPLDDAIRELMTRFL